MLSKTFDKERKTIQMLSVFNTLKSRYASSEITMEDLERLQEYDFIHFENRGISRSEHDCLLCEVRCEPLETLLKALKGAVFASADALRDLIRSTGLGLEECAGCDPQLLTFYSPDRRVEIVAAVDADGRVSVDPEDIEAEPFFQVYLRVQGF